MSKRCDVTRSSPDGTKEGEEIIMGTDERGSEGESRAVGSKTWTQYIYILEPPHFPYSDSM